MVATATLQKKLLVCNLLVVSVLLGFDVCSVQRNALVLSRLLLFFTLVRLPAQGQREIEARDWLRVLPVAREKADSVCCTGSGTISFCPPGASCGS